jgi:hypothetical protein
VLGQCRRFPVYQNRHANEWCGEYTIKIDHVIQDDIGFVEKRKYTRKVKDDTTTA